jgi:hypothetical protein
LSIRDAFQIGRAGTPAKHRIYPLDFFVVFARPEDTSRTGEKLCISFAVIFYRKARPEIAPA